MKRFQQIRNITAATLLVAITCLGAVPARSHAEATNLIANPGFETASASDGTTPSDWFSDSYGTNNAAFSYTTDAHSGTHAVQTTITNYTNGDAKWLFGAQPVTAGGNYTYSDWYKSAASTNVWAQFQLANGGFQYQFLKVAPIASDWKQTSVAITIPANVTALSVFHVLASSGQLEIDDVSLASNVTCTPSYINGLANGDFEDSCLSANGLPDGWTPEAYGTTNATYSYTTDAYHGSHAIAVTNPTDGAETGFTTAVNSPVAGQRYALNFAQNGNTYAYAYLAMGLSNGDTQYVSLMSVPATLGTWSLYTDSFILPANITSLDITIATSGVGTLNLDNVSLTSQINQTPATFTSGLVSLTYDDGAASTYTNGFSTLKKYSYKGTFYLNAGSLNTTGFMTTKQIQALAANGQEIGSHLYHHSDIVQIDTPTLANELGGNISALQTILGTSYNITDFATPYGSYTSDKIDTVMQYELTHRTTDGEMNTKANFNVRQIHARLVTQDTTAAEITALVKQAQADHSWLVLVYHNISATTTGEAAGEAGYTVTPARYKNQLAAINKSGIAVLPINAAVASLQAQITK